MGIIVIEGIWILKFDNIKIIVILRKKLDMREERRRKNESVNVLMCWFFLVNWYYLKLKYILKIYNFFIFLVVFVSF